MKQELNQNIKTIKEAIAHLETNQNKIENLENALDISRGIIKLLLELY